MPLRLGFVTAAHLHTAAHLENFRHRNDVEIVGVWDHDKARLDHCCDKKGLKRFDDLDALLEAVDAVVICSENKLHAKHCVAAASKGKHILCEKPLVTSEDEGEQIVKAVNASGVKFMVALPARYAPSFARLKERIASGEIGAIKAICATNRGKNPGGWFSIPEHSGGGAMSDHTVHVADLLWLLLHEEPSKVEAQLGHNMEGTDAEDCAMLTMEYPSGIFATLDSSWSRPKNYKNWGDLTLNVVGEKGAIELDMFAQQIQVYGTVDPSHVVADFGSDLYKLLTDDFVRCIRDDLPSPVPLEDGLRSSRVMIEAYKYAKPNGALQATGSRNS